MTTYYKVLQRPLGARENLSSFIESRFSVVYKPGEWVEPVLQGSKLFVSTNLEDLIRRAGYYRYHEIWQCEIENATSAPAKALNIDDSHDFWAGRLSGDEQDDNWPQTVWADRVKLTERVWGRNE